MGTRNSPKAPLALTMGEPAGIGAEIALMAWRERNRLSVPPFLVIDDPQRLANLAKSLSWNLPLRTVDRAVEANAHFAEALPVWPIELEAPATPGRPDQKNAAAVLRAIQCAVGLARRDEVAGVVTNPINKEVLYEAGFQHPGHTEYLAHLTESTAPAVMMLVCTALKVVPVTLHLPLRDAVRSLSAEAIVHCARTTSHALRRDFGIRAPRLAIAGLNPHAGEQGKLGREELEVLNPAIKTLRAEGIDIEDPAPADSLFHPAARRRYDAALCMYHDQALIPIKTIDFENGVNVTLGLPIVRTSPDHGTAFGLAGRGAASPASLIAALKTARQIADQRSTFDHEEGRG